MKTISTNIFHQGKILMLLVLLAFTACKDDDDTPVLPMPTGDNVVYTLSEQNGSGVNGTITFSELDNGAVEALIKLTGTPASGSHPAHIHMNTAAEGGSIAVTFEPVNGSTGESVTIFSETDNGTAINFDDILEYDGYVNVHLSASDLGTIVAQGDIGQNTLTGEFTEYTLNEVAVPGISGTATFFERSNNQTLVVIALENTPDGGEHPAHIHFNTAAEGGGIAIDLTSIDGATGLSRTNVADLNAGGAITYDELIDYDGYINVHLSAAALGTIVAQGDIGQNALTGESIVYPLDPVAVANISGDATFYQRNNDETLIVITLANTPEDGEHPAHIHFNTAAEGGGIAIDLTSIDGTTGMSRTNVAALNAGDAITYTQLLDYDGYINVHLNADDLGTIVAQGDIGQNALTGESKVYPLNSVAVPNISGEATLFQRKNNESLLVIAIDNTPADGSHPAHIHINSAAEGGAIAIDLQNVAGATGISRTNIAALNAGDAITYDGLLTFDGYINVHLSASELQTIVAQGNIGSNSE